MVQSSMMPFNSYTFWVLYWFKSWFGFVSPDFTCFSMIKITRVGLLNQTQLIWFLIAPSYLRSPIFGHPFVFFLYSDNKERIKGNKACFKVCPRACLCGLLWQICFASSAQCNKFWNKTFSTAPPLTSERVGNSTETGRKKYNIKAFEWRLISENLCWNHDPQIIKHCRQAVFLVWVVSFFLFFFTTL